MILIGLKCTSNNLEGKQFLKLFWFLIFLILTKKFNVFVCESQLETILSQKMHRLVNQCTNTDAKITTSEAYFCAKVYTF